MKNGSFSQSLYLVTTLAIAVRLFCIPFFWHQMLLQTTTTTKKDAVCIKEEEND